MNDLIELQAKITLLDEQISFLNNLKNQCLQTLKEQHVVYTGHAKTPALPRPAGRGRGNELVVRPVDLIYGGKTMPPSDLWRCIVKNRERNGMIVQDVLQAVGEGRFPLVLSQTRDHLDILARELASAIEFLAVLHGGKGRLQRWAVFEKTKQSGPGSKCAILTTPSYLDEEIFNLPRLDTVFLAMPEVFKGKVVKYTGYLHAYRTPKPIRIYDYVDVRIPVLEKRHLRRLKTLQMWGYETAQA